MDLDFVAIVMLDKKGRTLYLKASDRPSKGVICEWSYDYDEAIYFETDVEATKFANTYFKNFKGWTLKDVRAKL
jgi:hypothetical protein